MKKFFVSMLAVLLSLSLYSQGFCAQQERDSSHNNKSLIIYYSLSGNTKMVATLLHELIGGDIMEIKTVRPYPKDFHAVVEQAREERRTHFLPPIQNLNLNPQNYDTIYLGFPIWGSTLPQPMATFLSQHNLAGKTIVPFCIHDGYGTGKSFQAISSCCPNAKLLESFDMLGSDARNAKELLVRWLHKLGITAPKAAASVPTETPITITIGDVKLTGFLNTDYTAQEFKKLLPITIPMIHYGGREYYGGIDEKIITTEEGRLYFDDGDITYCPQNNSIAIFHAQTNRPNLTMKVIPIGKVTSNLSIFNKLDDFIQIVFDIHH